MYFWILQRRLFAAGGTLALLKITEPFSSDHVVSLFRVTIPDCVQPDKDTRQTAEPLRLDFYGDSDTASYGVDGSSHHPLKCLNQRGEPFENFLHGWVWALKQINTKRNICVFMLIVKLKENQINQ